MSRKTSSIVVGLAGDVMIGRLVEEKLSRSDPAYIWGDTLPMLKATDMNLVNLEAALTNSKVEVPKVFNFKAKPERVASLKLADIGTVTLANNHCLDYSEEGLLETLRVLDKAGIPHTGAGRNLMEARAPVLLDVSGIKVAILGFTDNEPTWLASSHSSGTNYITIDEGGLSRVAEGVGKVRDQVDLVILSIHWGPNMRERPPKHFRAFARKALECGVDIFHGHSAHIFQGVEIYNKKVIFYDTGDFVDDYHIDPVLRNDRSFFYTVEADKNGPSTIRLFPVLIGNCQVNHSEGHDRQAAIERMQMLSGEFGTALKVVPEGLLAKVA